MGKTIAIKTLDIALALGLSQAEALMAVAHKAVTDKEYKVLKKAGQGFRPVDLQTVNVPMPSWYDGLDQGSNPLIRVTYTNGVYLNNGQPSWIDLMPVRDMLDVNGVKVRMGDRVFWNKQTMFRVLIGEDTLVENLAKKHPEFIEGMPRALLERIDNGLPVHVIPFHYSASPKPRAAKGTGWWEVRMDLYRLTDMLDNPPAPNPNRRFGPRKDARAKGGLNSVQYGLIGHQETRVEAGRSSTATVFTGLYYVEWRGCFKDGEWFDSGSRVILLTTATVNRGRMAFLCRRCNPDVYRTDCGGHHILPMEVLEQPESGAKAEKPADKPAADGGNAKDEKPAADQGASDGANGGQAATATDGDGGGAKPEKPAKKPRGKKNGKDSDAPRSFAEKLADATGKKSDPPAGAAS